MDNLDEEIKNYMKKHPDATDQEIASFLALKDKVSESTPSEKCEESLDSTSFPDFGPAPEAAPFDLDVPYDLPEDAKQDSSGQSE